MRKLLQTQRVIAKGKAMRLLQGGSGKPLLFLHGWPANPLTYKHALELLAKRFTVYAPFMFDIKCKRVIEVANYIRIMLKELGLSQIIVVGTSFGGAIASSIAQDKRLVSRLILINPAGVPTHTPFAKMRTGFLKSSAYMLMHGKFEHVLYRFLAALSFFASLRHSERRKLFEEMRKSTNTHACYVFQNIKARTVILWCMDDKIFSVSHAPLLQKLIKDSKLVIVEGDHYWPFHKPKHFAETVLNNLKEVSTNYTKPDLLQV